MYVVVGLAIGLIIAGLVMTLMYGSIKQPMLALIVYYVGVVLVVIRLVLLVTPFLVWVDHQLRMMLGA